MFKNFNGFHLVDAYHSIRLERRFQPGRVFKKTVEAIVVVFLTLLLWNLPSSSFGIEGLNVVQQRIIDRLLAEGFIDEQRFCKAYALDKLRYNHWGRIKIDQMLRLLGCSSTHRREALDQLPDDEYMAILTRLAQIKLPTIKARNDYERKGKLMRFLTGKGFEMDLIREVADVDED